MNMQDRLDNDWTLRWSRFLTSEGAKAALVGGLLARWRKNQPSMVPGTLSPPKHLDAAADWSKSLELFLLSTAPSASGCANVLVSAIEEAFAQCDQNLGKLVWMRDVLALRRVAYADDEVRQRAAKLIISAISALNGISTQPTEKHYNHLERLFGTTTDCMVTELYERNFVDGWFSSGISVANFESFTVIWVLEKNRRALLEEQKGPEAPEDSICLLSEDPAWKTLAESYQSVADNLFETLLSISAQAMHLGDRTRNRTVFLDVLKVGRPNDLAKFLGFQRKLDIHWLRLSVIVSKSKVEIASLIRIFLVFLSRTDQLNNLKVSRSGLRDGPASILQPKNDPRAVLIEDTPMVGAARQVKYEIAETPQISELANKFPELQSALEGSEN